MYGVMQVMEDVLLRTVPSHNNDMLHSVLLECTYAGDG